ncbi:sentrin-specific protease 1-like [Olea europaea subsp. europaea]|uniref:Sentrin-specific protease 1-like n=1 Tax=Olea europaea subsp. europaea TaxID=158383 RepID=A0A8S0PWZ5_OLEEU|nr:sentrin-specific protease 1-like [Olea europaea subsp. europaea]
MAMPYMNRVQYNKPIPSTSSTESRRRTKRRTERSVEDAATSGKSVLSVLPLMDSNIGQAHSSDDDDDFIDLPPRQQEPSARGISPVVECPTAAHHSQEEPQSHGAQRDDAFKVLRVQVFELQVDNKVLKVELEEIKSHMSSLNKWETNKMDDIVQMQACIKSNLMDIRTNMQFLSESVSTMISSAMDEIIRRSGDRTSERGGSPTVEPTSKLPVKRVLRPSRVFQSPFVAGQERGKLFNHDDIAVVFEDYKDNVDEVDKSAFMGWFQRGYKPKNKKKFSEEDDTIKIAKFGKNVKYRATTINSWFQIKIKDIFAAFMKDPNVLMSESSLLDVVTGKSYCDWKVLQGIEPYVKVLPALMNALGISKDLDYHEPEAKELKVIIDDTFPQQTNGHDCGIFVVLYALYLIRDGRYSIPKKFDASKFRMDIATLLYKYRQVYTKKVNQPVTGEALVIE